MTTELKDKWVQALESGRYEQTTGRLRRNDQYCCLGVLLDVAGYAWSPAAREGCWRAHDSKGYSMGQALTITACDEIGLETRTQDHLIALNDSGRSFNEIATYIRGAV